MRISDWSSDVCSSDLPRTHVLYDVLRLSRSVVVDFKFGDRDRLDFGDERRIAREIAVAERISLAHAAARAAKPCNDGRCRVAGNLAIGRMAGPCLDLLIATSGRSEEHTSELQSLMRI